MFHPGVEGCGPHPTDLVVPLELLAKDPPPALAAMDPHLAALARSFYVSGPTAHAVHTALVRSRRPDADENFFLNLGGTGIGKTSIFLATAWARMLEAAAGSDPLVVCVVPSERALPGFVHETQRARCCLLARLADAATPGAERAALERTLALVSAMHTVYLPDLWNPAAVERHERKEGLKLRYCGERAKNDDTEVGLSRAWRALSEFKLSMPCERDRDRLFSRFQRLGTLDHASLRPEVGVKLPGPTLVLLTYKQLGLHADYVERVLRAVDGPGRAVYVCCDECDLAKTETSDQARGVARLLALLPRAPLVLQSATAQTLMRHLCAYAARMPAHMSPARLAADDLFASPADALLGLVDELDGARFVAWLRNHVTHSVYADQHNSLSWADRHEVLLPVLAAAQELAALGGPGPRVVLRDVLHALAEGLGYRHVLSLLREAALRREKCIVSVTAVHDDFLGALEKQRGRGGFSAKEASPLAARLYAALEHAPAEVQRRLRPALDAVPWRRTHPTRLRLGADFPFFAEITGAVSTESAGGSLLQNFRVHVQDGLADGEPPVYAQEAYQRYSLEVTGAPQPNLSAAAWAALLEAEEEAPRVPTQVVRRLVPVEGSSDRFRYMPVDQWNRLAVAKALRAGGSMAGLMRRTLPADGVGAGPNPLTFEQAVLDFNDPSGLLIAVTSKAASTAISLQQASHHICTGFEDQVTVDHQLRARGQRATNAKLTVHTLSLRDFRALSGDELRSQTGLDGLYASTAGSVPKAEARAATAGVQRVLAAAQVAAAWRRAASVAAPFLAERVVAALAERGALVFSVHADAAELPAGLAWFDPAGERPLSAREPVRFDAAPLLAWPVAPGVYAFARPLAALGLLRGAGAEFFGGDALLRHLTAADPAPVHTLDARWTAALGAALAALPDDPAAWGPTGPLQALAGEAAADETLDAALLRLAAAPREHPHEAEAFLVQVARASRACGAFVSALAAPGLGPADEQALETLAPRLLGSAAPVANQFFLESMRLPYEQQQRVCEAARAAGAACATEAASTGAGPARPWTPGATETVAAPHRGAALRLQSFSRPGRGRSRAGLVGRRVRRRADAAQVGLWAGSPEEGFGLWTPVEETQTHRSPLDALPGAFESAPPEEDDLWVADWDAAQRAAAGETTTLVTGNVRTLLVPLHAALRAATGAAEVRVAYANLAAETGPVRGVLVPASLAATAALLRKEVAKVKRCPGAAKTKKKAKRRAPAGAPPAKRAKGAVRRAVAKRPASYAEDSASGADEAEASEASLDSGTESDE